MAIAEQNYDSQVFASKSVLGWYRNKHAKNQDRSEIDAWCDLHHLNEWNRHSWTNLFHQLDDVYKSRQAYIQAAHEMFTTMGFTEPAATALLHRISSHDCLDGETIDQLVKLWVEYQTLSNFVAAEKNKKNKVAVNSFPLKNGTTANMIEAKMSELLSSFQLIAYSKFIPLDTDIQRLEGILVGAQMTVAGIDRAQHILTACEVHPAPATLQLEEEEESSEEEEQLSDDDESVVLFKKSRPRRAVTFAS